MYCIQVVVEQLHAWAGQGNKSKLSIQKKTDNNFAKLIREFYDNNDKGPIMGSDRFCHLIDKLCQSKHIFPTLGKGHTVSCVNRAIEPLGKSTYVIIYNNISIYF